MSATSEELAAQAETLQSSIAYFRTEENASEAPRRQAPASHAPAAKAARPAARPAPAARTAAKPAPIGAAKLIGQVQAAYGNGKAGAAKPGFRLDMASGGPDHHDAQFERAS